MTKIEEMLEIIYTLPNTFIPLFVAMDAPAGLAIFISMTEGLTEDRVKKIVSESILTAFFVSMSFLALGEFVFNILGISENDFRIAGGILLLTFAILDLVGDTERRKPAGKFGIVPIGVPLIAGPAVLTTITLLVDNYGVYSTGTSLLLNLFIVWVLFRKAEVIVRFFGKGGISVLSKIMLLLLSAIAIMLIRTGIQGIAQGS